MKTDEPTDGWLRGALRPLSSIDAGWLQEWLPSNAVQRLLGHAAGQHRHASRLVTRQLQAQGEQPLWGSGDDAPPWLAEPAPTQHTLATLLGAMACSPWLRSAVARESVAQLVDALGNDGYRFALAERELQVEGLVPFQQQRIGPHLTAVGAALLEINLRRCVPATRFRLRLILPPAVWRARPQALVADEVALAAAASRALVVAKKAQPPC
jgi:hypothetical protein